MTAPPTKVLLVRFSSIGDIVLTTPIVRAIKQQWGSEVHFLTKPAYAALLAHNPYIDRLHLLPKDFGALTASLRAERFDFVVDLHKNLRTLRLRAALRCPWVAFDKLNLRKWLLVNFKIDRMPALHIVERYRAAAHSAHPLYLDGRGLDYFLPPDGAFYDPEVLLNVGLEPLGYVAVVIGAAHATKRLPEAQLLEVCRQIELPIALLGGPAERAAGEQLAAQFGERCHNFCGYASLHESARLLRDAQRVITPDTGMMHIAAAFNKPIVSVWGNTVPALGMTPWLPREAPAPSRLFEVPGLDCRPCSKIGYAECPKGHFKCMRQQDTTAIGRTLAPNAQRRPAP